MAAVTQVIPNFLGGVSKQIDQKKLPGQVRECLNALPDPTFGLTKRPGFKWIENLSPTLNPTDAKWFYINRDDVEDYIGCITDGTPGKINIWNAKTGVLCNIHDDIYSNSIITNTNTGTINLFEVPVTNPTLRTITQLTNTTALGAVGEYSMPTIGPATQASVTTNGEGGGTDSSYTNVSPTGGSGSGMIVTANVNGGVLTTVTVTTEGTSAYAVGDVLTIANTDIGTTNADATITITRLQPVGLEVIGEVTDSATGALATVVTSPTGNFLGTGYEVGDEVTVDVSGWSGGSMTGAYTFVIVNQIGTGSGMKVNITTTLDENNNNVYSIRSSHLNTGTGYVDRDDLEITPANSGLTSTITFRSTAPTSNYFELPSPHIPHNNYDVLTVQDTSIITNKTKVVKGLPKPTNYNPQRQATINLTAINYSCQYRVNIDIGSGFVNAVDYTTINIEHVDLSTAGAAEIKSNTAESLLTEIESQLNAWSGNNGSIFTVTRLPASLEIVSTIDFKIEAIDGLGNIGMVAFREQVNTVADIPSRSVNGRIMKVVNSSNGQTSDNYWTTFYAENGVAGDGNWEETVDPTVSPGLDSDTMPHELKSIALNTFVIQKAAWDGRAVGDENTNSDPSFLENTIQQAFLYNSRLGFLTEDNVSMSRTGFFNDFYHASALTITDDDPIDVNCSSIRPAKLHAILPTAQGLILFSQNQQFILFADAKILTPSAAIIRGISNYEMDVNIDPVDVGTTIKWCSKTPSYTRVFAAQTRGSEESPLVHDIGKVVSEYIPKDVNNLLGSAQNELIALYGSSLKDVYFHKMHTAGKDVAMQAWFKWTLPGKVNNLALDSDILTAVVENNGIYSLISCSLTQTPDEEIIINSDGQQINPHMDYYSTPSSIKYKEVTGITLDFDGRSGAGYSGQPNVHIGTLQSTGSGATATCTITNPVINGNTSMGVVTGFTLTNGGSGYESPPNVTVGDFWEEGKDYVVGDQVIHSDESYLWTCTTAGKSGNRRPWISAASPYVVNGTIHSDKGSSTNTGASWTNEVIWSPWVPGWKTPAMKATFQVAETNTDDFTRCYLPYPDITDLNPVIVIPGNGTTNFSGVTESGFTISPERGSDNIGPYFKIPRKNLTESEIVLGYAYNFDVELPKTYFKLNPEGTLYDYTAALTVARLKFSVGLSSVLGFKLKSKGYAGESANFIGDGTETDFQIPFVLKEENGVKITIDDAQQDIGTYEIVTTTEGNVEFPNSSTVKFNTAPTGHTIKQLYPGSGYSANTNIPTTSNGEGSGLTVDTTVSGGEVQSVTINQQGSGYKPDEVVTITGGHINTISYDADPPGLYNWNGPYFGTSHGGNPYTIVGDCVAAGLSGNACNQYTTTSANGTGAEFLVTINPGYGNILNLEIVNKGVNFVVGDTITISGYDLGFNKYSGGGGGGQDPPDTVITVTGVEEESKFLIDKVPQNIKIATDTWYDVQPVQDAGQYLLDDVPLEEDTVFTIPIHQRNENFNVRVFSNSPFPASLNSLMWEGNYSPRFYRRT